MAKREISSTLKNLKFMQRAALKEERPKKVEEVIPAGDFPSSSAVKRCVVIVEGDPHPGATRGRMSFLSFNPSIDKLNEEESNPCETAATSSGRQNDATSVRENGSSQHSSDKLDLDYSNGDLKRKQDEAASDAQYPNKSKKTDKDSQASSPNTSRSSQKQHKREKLDWSVLRPPKYQSKKK